MYLNDSKPITPQQAYNGNFWRLRAELTRAKSESLNDEALKARLLKVATDYERLARRADVVQTEMKNLLKETWSV